MANPLQLKVYFAAMKENQNATYVDVAALTFCAYDIVLSFGQEVDTLIVQF